MYIGKSQDNQKDILHVESMNRSIAYQNEAMIAKENRERDTFALSSEARQKNMLQTLRKQRQDLVDTKEKAAEQTEAAELEEYDVQITSLDETIAQLQAQSEEDTEEFSGIYERPQVKQETVPDAADGSAHDAAYTLSVLRMQMIGCTDVLELPRETLYPRNVPNPSILNGPVTQIGSLMIQRLHRAPDIQEESNVP